MPIDLYITEKNGTGGDYVFTGTDLAKTESEESEIYLSMFGGNVEADTQPVRVPGEIDESYWANAVLFKRNKYTMMNSQTERILRQVSLNSSGRIAIENAIKNDLKNISERYNIQVSVRIVGVDKIAVTLKITGTDKMKTFEIQPNNINGDFSLNDFDLNDFF